MRAWITSLLFYSTIYFICEIMQQIIKKNDKFFNKIELKYKILFDKILIEVNLLCLF